MKQTRSTNSREKLLDAAEVVVMERGANSMTLDAVAAQANVSKGGLLYQFAFAYTHLRAHETGRNFG
jgi:AcrR family transcriptional regulator